MTIRSEPHSGPQGLLTPAGACAKIDDMMEATQIEIPASVEEAAEAVLDASNLVPPGSIIASQEPLSEALCGTVRELCQDDVDLYKDLDPRKIGRVQNIKERHHEMARRLALGERQVDVCRDMNFTQTQLSILVNHSEAFQELLAHYRTERTVATMNFEQKISVAAVTSIERLDDLLQDEDELSPEFVRRCTMDLLDRAGHAPVQRVDKRVQHGASPALLAAVKQRVDKREAESTFTDVECVEEPA